MTDDKKVEEKSFADRTKDSRMEKTHEVLPELLVFMLKEDINYRDFHYVITRAREIVGDSFEGVNFKSEGVILAREALMKATLNEIRAGVKVLDKEVKDETDERDMRCEASAHKVVEIILSDKVLLSDGKYFRDAIENDDMLLPRLAISGYIDSFYDVLLTSLGESERKAMKILWGTDLENVKLSKLESILKDK